MLEFEQVHRRGVVRVTFWASWKFAADVTTNRALWIARFWIEIVVNYAHLIVKFLDRNVISHSLGHSPHIIGVLRLVTAKYMPDKLLPASASERVSECTKPPTKGTFI